ncbi:alpha/beta-hydrolase [Punctularia strigosozonata HHB-11173 SS5]|uniref:alpha/beta-hydrolase n=1 Tax=Punctularia strigosozonata (strain HHB-11173) TaxID=741275 RepID=UPI000441657D|nr:alpha/beta-hydrolase [Punctularia strigosozonata HHB-11173 SS5]EIN11741.1 alpha/beta-hydrolase [Punctularia strigosozonata HHB-11173 SS5]
MTVPVKYLAMALLAATAFAFPGPVLRPRPLVLWHGLGDSHSSPGMLEFIELIKETHPGIFIHSVYIEKDLEADRKAGWFGNVDEQLAFVAEELAEIPELQGGFDGLGFSQGGQFLRAYVERYNSPRIHNLLTFGSQHMGVSDLPLCRPGDWTCQLAGRMARRGVYTKWAQHNLVQAQYFRDPTRMSEYLAAGSFLADINNEVKDPAARNGTYKENLTSLDNLVLILFSQDRTVVPKESSWFGSEAPTEDEEELAQMPTPDADGELVALVAPEMGDGRQSALSGVSMVHVAPAGSALDITSSEKDESEEDVASIGQRWPGSEPPTTIVPMRLQPLYVQDWIGLRTLDERGSVHLETCEGEHMEVTQECWEPLVKKYVGKLVVPPASTLLVEPR